MKEYMNKDVADFFKEKTTGFEKVPPESVWENISNSIPSNIESGHFQSFIKNIYMFPVLISGVAIVAMMYFIKPNLEIENTNIAAITEQISEEAEATATITDLEETPVAEEIKIEEVAPVENIIKEEIKEIKKTEKIINNKNIIVAKSIPVKYDTTFTSSKQILISANSVDDIVNVKKRIYNISATNFVNIEKIQFVNNNKEQELVKEIVSPTLTAFGYYEIDITDLEPGTYKVKVLTEGDWVDHKIETFN